MNELKGSEKYRDILARGFRAGWSHSESLDKSGKVKQKLGALLARKMAKITGKTVAKKTGKGVLASIPGISLVISAIDYPARASEFGTGTAIGMSIFDNIPILDVSLAITEGIDSVQQERIKASREGAIEEQAAIDDFMREAEQAGMDYE
ncbi:MAG: hypothetical protein NTU79_17930 [Planctomycetota bacterium]|nr:hypothetical protein [Planctomycetota bacterium]